MIVERALRFGIRGEQYLKTAIQQKAFVFIGANAAAERLPADRCSCKSAWDIRTEDLAASVLGAFSATALR